MLKSMAEWEEAQNIALLIMHENNIMDPCFLNQNMIYSTNFVHILT